MPRKLKLMARADRQRRTRERIVEAAVALHGTVGPARTTISEIAATARVQRLTVYRHFPNAEGLLQACSEHYTAGHPPPDPRPWFAIKDPVKRLRRSLTDLYAYYRRTEAMNTNLFRDAKVAPLVADVLLPYQLFVSGLTDRLVKDWPPRGSPHVLHASVHHALEFETWQAFVRRANLKDEEVVALMVELAVAGHRTVGGEEGFEPSTF